MLSNTYPRISASFTSSIEGTLPSIGKSFFITKVEINQNLAFRADFSHT